jgi:hypothetical protein
MSEIKSVEELKAEGDEFHARLLEDDITVTAEIANVYLEPLVKILLGKYPQLDDPHFVPTAVEDALLSYFNRPEQFDPRRGISLFSYLQMSAIGDLKNLLQNHKAHIEKLNYDEPVEEFVELPLYEPEYKVEKDDQSDLEVPVEWQNPLIEVQLTELLPNIVDQKIMRLMMEGERATHTFANVLGILDLPSNEQRKIVKRNKDRIKKIIQRHIKWSDLNNG